MDRNMKQIGMAGLLVTAGALGRIYLRSLLPHLPHFTITINGITQPLFIPDMFFWVATASLMSGILLKGYYTIFVPLMIMSITDIFYGNNYIFLFTWSGFAFISLIGYISSKKLLLNGISVAKLTGIGIGSTLLYDAWTNFGWWLGPYYPHTLNGLALCYTFAIPFTIWHLISTGIMLIAISPLALYIKDAYFERSASRHTFENYIPWAISLSLAGASIWMAL